MRSIAIAAALALSAPLLAHSAQVPLVDVAQLSARSNHACVVTTAGTAKCWGSNSRGQLGGGPVGGASSYREAATEVVGLASGVVSIAAATGDHTCAVVAGGAVKCWGANDQGQLGDGTLVDRPLPVDVQGLPSPTVAVAGGVWHTCALSAAGAVWCWGRNAHGQLGDGTTTERVQPVPVSGLSSGVTAISAAREHTCAVLDTGAVRCWGANAAGELGDGTRTEHSTPYEALAPGSGATAIAAGGTDDVPFNPGYRWTCAIASGIAKCWGGYVSGAVQTPADVPGAGNATQVTVGGLRVQFGRPTDVGGHFTQFCVLGSDGRVRCWGENWCGLVGNGTYDCSYFGGVYIPPAAEVVGLSNDVRSVSAASRFTCALTLGGEVKCWGPAYGGQAAPAVEGTTPQEILLEPGWHPQLSVQGVVQIPPPRIQGGSGNPVVFSSLTPQTCSVSGNTVTGLAGGDCTIAANQAGNAYFDPAPQVTVTIAVDPRRAQAITVAPLPSQLVVDGVASIAATSSSGLPVTISPWFASNDSCSISGSVLKGTVVGTCYLGARQAGDADHFPAEVFIQIPVVANSGTRGLVVHIWGGGSGQVSSTPAGIDCGTLCASNHTAGTLVTLTATPAFGSQFDGWSGACSGTGPCSVTLDAPKTVTARFDSDTVRLSALSTRATVLPDGGALIGGFIIGGAESKTVLVRARGPSLDPFVASPTLVNPTMQLIRMSDRKLVAVNDDWRQNSTTWEVTQALGLGVFDSEAAILATLPPGAYTAVVFPLSNFAHLSGLGIFEVFEIDRAAQSLTGISTRGQVQPGEGVMIAGFIIEGSGSQTVIVRGIGPSLASHGVTGALGDPTLQLVRMADNTVIVSNDNWRQAPNADEMIVKGIAPANDLESAILVTLAPGAYTAILSGTGGMTGNAMVEVYKVIN